MLEGKSNQKMVIICAYQVCKNARAQAGNKTAYTQQWHILREQGITNTDPRKQFITDFTNELCMHLEQQHDRILVILFLAGLVTIVVDACSG
jgi:hypothetical protein